MPGKRRGRASDDFFDAVCDYCDDAGGPVAVVGPCGHVLCLVHAPAACRPTDPSVLRVIVEQAAECPMCGKKLTLALWSRRSE